MSSDAQSGSALSVRVVGRVRAAMHEAAYILVDGSDERQYMVNRKVAGQLWGKLKVGNSVELSVVPGELSRVVAVSLYVE